MPRKGCSLDTDKLQLPLGTSARDSEMLQLGSFAKRKKTTTKTPQLLKITPNAPPDSGVI